MSAEYSVEEVLESARKAAASNGRAKEASMLFAYAERIKAYEVKTLGTCPTHGVEYVGECSGCAMTLPEKDFTYPPAQAEVTDAVVQRAEQAFWPIYSECKRVHETRKDAHATGMRAALLAVWPNPPAQADEGAVPVAFRFLGPDGEAVTEWEDAPITDKKFPDLRPSIESVQYAYLHQPARAAQVEGSVSPVMQQADAVSPALIKPAAKPVAQADGMCNADNPASRCVCREEFGRRVCEPVTQGEATLCDREDVRALIDEMANRINALTNGTTGKEFEYRHLSLPNSDGDQVWLPWQKFDPKMQIRCLAAQPRAVPANEVTRVAQHIALAVEYIEKQWPDAKQLDRGPILRNMRRWRDRLLAAAPSPGESE